MTVDEYDNLNARIKTFEDLEGDIEQAKALSKSIDAFRNSKNTVQYTITVTPVTKDLSESEAFYCSFNDKSMTFNQSVGSMLAELLNKHAVELERQMKDL